MSLESNCAVLVLVAEPCHSISTKTSPQQGYIIGQTCCMLQFNLIPLTVRVMAKGQRDVSHLPPPGPHHISQQVPVAVERLPRAKSSSVSFIAIVIPTLPRKRISIQGSMNTLLPQASLHHDIFSHWCSGKYKAALTSLRMTNGLTTASQLKCRNEGFNGLLRFIVKTSKHGEKTKGALSHKTTTSDCFIPHFQH